MERMTLTDAVNEISQAMADLNQAKAKYKGVVESTLDAYFGEINVIGKETYTVTTAAQRTEAKNIKKLAKAMLKGSKQEAKDEAENMANLIEELG